MPAAAVLAALPAVATDVCTNTACTGAYSHRDECECTACEDGAGHGIQYRIDAARGAASIRARIIRTGDVFLGAASNDDDEPW